MTGKAIGLELNQGYAGQPSRQAPVPEIFTRPASTDLDFGAPVKVNDDGQYELFVADTDDLDTFAGIVTRGVQQTTVYTLQDGETGYEANLPCAVMKKGFIIVNVGDSTPAPNGKVYISGSSFTATEDSAVEIPCLRFTTGKKDGNNNAEIEIGYLPLVVTVTA